MDKILLSLKKNKVGIMIILFSAICTAFGQYCWKVWEAKGLLTLFIGFVLYGIGAVSMIIAFKFEQTLNISLPVSLSKFCPRFKEVKLSQK